MTESSETIKQAAISQLDRVDVLKAQLRKLDISVDKNLLTEASALVAPASFSSLLSLSTAPAALPEVWRRAFNHVPATPAGLLVSLAVRETMTVGERALGTDLGAGLSYWATWRFVNVQTAGLLYRFGLDALGRGSDLIGRNALEQALEHWKEVEKQDHKLKGKTARMWRGMRAVALLALARRDPNALPLLRVADGDMRIAAERGDRTIQHYCLHLEILVRLIDEGDDRAADAQLLVDEAERYCAASREWLVGRSDLAMRVGWALEPAIEVSTTGVHRADLGQAELQYSLAIYLLDRALSVAPNKLSPDTLVLARRGMAKARYAAVLITRRDRRNRADGALTDDEIALELAEDRALLDAVTDLRAGMSPDAPIQGTALAGTLLRIAYRAHERKSYDECRIAASEKYDYCLRHPDLVPVKIRNNLSSLTWECELRTSVDTADVPKIRCWLDQLGTLPSEVDRAAAPITYAARILLSSRPVATQDMHRIDVVVSVLHRQTLRTPYDGARSFMASHAATLLSLQMVLPIGPDDRVAEPGSQPIEDVRRGSWDRPDGWPSALERGEANARIALLRRIYFLASIALESTPMPGLSSFRLHMSVGRAALRYAKALLTENHDLAAALPLLEEAIGRFEHLLGQTTVSTESLDVSTFDSLGSGEEVGNSFEQNESDAESPANDGWIPDIMTLASTAGEAYLRLNGITREAVHAGRAIDLLTMARDLGNTAPQLVGLLADAYYRRGRDLSNIEDLQRATRLKEECRDAGHGSRENLSVSGAAHYGLWQLTNDTAEYVSAVRCVAEAWAGAIEWPWPLLQLASFGTAPADVREALSRSRWPVSAAAYSHLLSLVARGDVGSLNSRAAQAAVQTREFRQTVLGGRTSTFVLDDPHRLLSATLVLKPTSQGNARAEAQAITSLKTYLIATGAPPWMQVPDIVAVVPLPGDWPSRHRPSPTTSLVTRRAIGVNLAVRIGAFRREIGPNPEVDALRAIQYLAKIHAWRGGPKTARGAAALNNVGNKFERDTTTILGKGQSLIRSLWGSACPSLPTVRFRDAHAENWIIGPTGEVVALDLESGAVTPILFEVAQLLDDFPLFEVDDTGCSKRLQMTNCYFAELDAAGFSLQLTAEMTQAALIAFILSRVAFLGAYLPSRVNRIGSTGGRQFAMLRLNHALALASYIADAAPVGNLRKVAGLLVPGLASVVERPRYPRGR